MCEEREEISFDYMTLKILKYSYKLFYLTPIKQSRHIPVPCIGLATMTWF